MSTLDDSPEFASGITSSLPAAVAQKWGDEVHALLAGAAASPLVRTQRLGIKACDALDALAKALKVEAEIAEHAAAIARLRKGGE